MRKILLLIDSLTQGGAQRQIVGLAKLLKDHGYPVVLLTYHEIPFYAAYLDKHGVEHNVIKDATSLLKRIWKVRQALKKECPDVIISYLDVPNELACLAKTMGMKAKLIVSERNTTQRLSLHERVRFFLYRWADHVVPNSMSQADFIANHYPGLLPKVTTISNFVDLEVFKPGEKKRQDMPMRIIGAGRIEPQKNILRFIKAVACVRQKGCDIQVDWYGRKSFGFEHCEQVIKEHRLKDFFIFHDPTNDIVSKYQQSDLFCLPSLYEGYPNVLCEAMACGLPVVCSDVCDNAKIMENGINGFLFNPRKEEDIANALFKYWSLTEQKRKEMAIKSRELALQKFGIDVFIQKYISLIENSQDVLYFKGFQTN